MTALLEAIGQHLPRQPARLPVGHYVYGIYVSDHLRYIGKGSGSRAWDHFSLILLAMEAALQGCAYPDALMFHRLSVREIAGHSGQDAALFRVHIFDEDMAEAAAFALEERLIRSYPLYIESTGDSSGLWNCGGRGLSIAARTKTAEAAYLDGDYIPFDNGKRKRPTRRYRKDMEYLHGNGFGAHRRVIAPTEPLAGADERVHQGG